jgi:Sec-independent protein translocase protein TatA
MAIYGPGQANKPVGGGFKEQLMGSPGRYRTETNYDPRQLQNFEQIGQMGMNNMQNPYQGFEPIQNEAMRQFNTQTVPGIAEQFTAMGGGQRSSNFGKSLGQAGAGLQSMLAAQRAQYGQNQQDFGLRQAGLGQTQKYSMEYEPGQEGLLAKGGKLALEAGMHYATGGLTGIPAAANLLGKGVEAFKNRGQQGQNTYQQQAQQQISGMNGGQKRNMLNRLRSANTAQGMQPQFQQAEQTAAGIRQQYPNIQEQGTFMNASRPGSSPFGNEDLYRGNPQQGQLPQQFGNQLSARYNNRPQAMSANYPSLSNPNYLPVGMR